jgi:hypothetical protein
MPVLDGAARLTDEALEGYDNMMLECVPRIENFASLAVAVWSAVLKVTPMKCAGLAIDAIDLHLFKHLQPGEPADALAAALLFEPRESGVRNDV